MTHTWCSHMGICDECRERSEREDVRRAALMAPFVPAEGSSGYVTINGYPTVGRVTSPGTMTFTVLEKD